MSGLAEHRPPQEVLRDIRAFLLGAESLPSPRGTALKLVEIASDPDASLDDAMNIVKTDPALTAFTLRAAASARFYGMSDKLDLRRAIQRLGLNAIRAHALTLSLVSQRDLRNCPGFDYGRFWVGALHTGILTESLADRCIRRPEGDTFSLGLLADIGRLAFATAVPDEYAALLQTARSTSRDLGDLERQAFGFDHHELSSVLLADWQLPTAMADLVYWQTDPEGGGFAAGSPRHQLASVLQLARSLSEAALNPGREPENLATAALRAAILELDPTDMRAVLAASIPPLREWTALVGLPVPSVSSSIGKG